MRQALRMYCWSTAHEARGRSKGLGYILIPYWCLGNTGNEEAGHFDNIQTKEDRGNGTTVTNILSIGYHHNVVCCTGK
jgi:hypothetical protein